MIKLEARYTTGMTSVGETLRRARLQRNLELNRIADELKISASMLKAIEEERFDKLPGGVFARSFVRQYARLLELNEDEIIGELKNVLQPPPEMPEIEHAHAAPAPDGEIPLPRMSGWQAVSDKGARWYSSVGALVLMVIVMMACAGAYAWWQRARHAAVVHVKSEVTTPAAAPASEPAAQPAASAPAPSQPEPALVTPEPTAPIKPATVVTTEPASAAPSRTERAIAPASGEPAAVKPAAVKPAAEPDPNAALQVEVTAEEASWIWVRADGQYQFSGVLEAHQTHTVAANRNVLLKLGNAGGVAVRLNGKAIGPFGAKGAVRTIQLTSGGFQIVPPDVPKPAPPTESPNPF